MQTITHTLTLLKPEVLIRFKLDPDNVQSPVSQSLGYTTWVDFDTAFGPPFKVGTEHQIKLLNPPTQSRCYRVSRTPVLNEIQYKTGKRMPMTTIYLAPVS